MIIKNKSCSLSRRKQAKHRAKTNKKETTTTRRRLVRDLNQTTRCQHVHKNCTESILDALK